MNATLARLREQMRAVPTSRWATLGRAFCLAVGLSLVATVNHFADYPHIAFNDAWNLEIAQSLSSDFCYCKTYSPRRVFPAEESSNGPLQYVGAFFFKVGNNNPDIAMTGTATVGTLLIVVALFILEPWLVILAAILFLAWPAFDNLSFLFLGEIWAIGFALLGIGLLRRTALPGNLLKLLWTSNFILACVCFGLAMESKFLSIGAIAPIVFALAYQKLARPGLWPTVLNLIRAAVVSAMTTLGGLVVLVLAIAFSVAHSTRSFDVHAMTQASVAFMSFMLSTGQIQSEALTLANLLDRIAHFSSALVVVFFFVSSAVLIYRNWTYLVPVAVVLAMWLKVGADENHIVIAFYLIIVLGALESEALVRRLATERGLSVANVNAVLAALVLIVIWRTIPTPIHIFRITPEDRHTVATSLGAYHYTPMLAKMLRGQKYVATSGWWEFPELSIREGLRFYDRTSPSTALLPKDQVALLFDKGNKLSPITSVESNCGRIIYEEGPMVLCHARADHDLDFQLHTVLNPVLPTRGPNLLANPSFSQGSKGWIVGTPAMKTKYDASHARVMISLSDAVGAKMLTQDLRLRSRDTVVVKATVTVSGASLPRLAGADVIFIDTVDGQRKGGDGVDSSVGLGSFPIAFEFTPTHDVGQLLLFVHVQGASNDETVISFSNLKVAYLKKAAAVKPK